jgi:SHS2 domain-containing protein
MDDYIKQMVRIVEHSGDLEIIASGSDELEAIANASGGLISQIVPLDCIFEREHRSIVAAGDTDADRIIAFLNELLYLVFTQHWLPRRVRTLSRCNRHGCRELEAVLTGEPVDPARHDLKYDIKAVTYHRFNIVNTPAGVTLSFVCDL